MVIFALAFVTAAQTPSVQETPVFPQLYKPPVDGLAIARIDMNAPVCLMGSAKEGIVRFPIPSDYEGQKVISFEVKSNPPEALKSWKWVNRPDGLNRVCEVTVAPTGKGAMITYDATILVPSQFSQPSTEKRLPEWLKPTKCVQSDDPAIVAVAKTLAGKYPNRDDLVAGTEAWVAKNLGKPGEAFTSLDASRGLLCGGSCTNHANLCAALLRANGIPARTVAHMPTWVGAEKFYQHWLTEYWKPGSGWVMVEPTLGLFHPARNTAVVLAISSAEDENKAFDPVHERLSMPGSPYLSLAELSPELNGADIVDTDAINKIDLIGLVKGEQPNGALGKAAARLSSIVANRGFHGTNTPLQEKKIQDAFLHGGKDLEKLLATSP